MRDPRLRGKYLQWLADRPAQVRNPPGLDRNAGFQAQAAVQGQQTYRKALAPRYGAGDRLQQFLRNRGTEQSGAQRPATVPSVQYGPAPRRF